VTWTLALAAGLSEVGFAPTVKTLRVSPTIAIDEMTRIATLSFFNVTDFEVLDPAGWFPKMTSTGLALMVTCGRPIGVLLHPVTATANRTQRASASSWSG
jgi:hypothetical protein